MKDNDLTNEEQAKYKELLDAGLEQLEPSTLLRLREGRLAAVALADGKCPLPFALPRWAASSAIASLAVGAVATSLWLAAPHTTGQDKPVEEIELLTAQGHFEMYEELEFYKWLADSDNGKKVHKGAGEAD